MEFSTKALSADKAIGPALVVGIHEKGRLSAAAELADQACSGALRAVIAAGDFSGKAGVVRVIYPAAGSRIERIVMVGLGAPGAISRRTWREVVTAAVRSLLETGARRASLALAGVEVDGADLRWKARHAALCATETAWRFEEMKSKRTPARPLARLEFLVDGTADLRPAARGLREGEAIGSGSNLARELGNLPGNVCTPTYLANRARRLGRDLGLAVKVLDRRQMAALGMHSLLSVSRGSAEPPRFIVMEYRGASARTRPVVLVGKGITFDTGGISLKPGAEMDEMKFDMCGAASVFGAMRAAAGMKLPINLTGIVPACENMPDGNASKPGDIVTTMSGQTVEILNTDAEGRLILCDALTWAERCRPEVVIDIATLTGACVIALGHVASGLFSNDEALAADLLAAGEAASDRAWRLPLWDDYMEQLKSNFADTANIGGRAAGSVTAAMFLSRFTREMRWAHLDIAGTAWKSGAQKGATGRPVPLLTQFLIDHAEKPGR
jgi:leucyl aminopeptidase